MLVPSLDLAVPVLKKLPECADLSKTVLPYLPQLFALPQQLYANINNVDALKSLYLSTNPLVTSLALAIFLAPVFLIVSEVNKNYSQVDRCWSILPTLYNCHYALWAHQNGLPAQRLDHIMAVSLLWSARLTFNYWRKGGYSVGSEDYRWQIVKEYIGPVGMFVLNVTFISTIQSILLWSITAPTYVLLLASRITGDGLSDYDTIFSRIMFGLVLLEFFADGQQWNFHQAKAKYQATAQPPKDKSYTREQLDRGFNTTGLFAYSRHPNFAAEQSFWVVLYQWCCCETYVFMNWTFFGAMSYLLLFQGSTWLTEAISADKYPEYKVYQQRVGKFLPKLKTLSMDKPATQPKPETAQDIKTPEAKPAKQAKSNGKTKKR